MVARLRAEEKADGRVYTLRIIFVWITAIFLWGVIVFAWYASQPLVYSIVTVANSTLANIENSTTVTTKSSQTATVLLLFNNIWAPIMVIIVLVWAVISSQREDPYSRWED